MIKARPLPEAKPTEPIDLPARAQLLSSIDGFKAALLSCEQGNAHTSDNAGRAGMNEWSTQQLAELLAQGRSFSEQSPSGCRAALSAQSCS